MARDLKKEDRILAHYRKLHNTTDIKSGLDYYDALVKFLKELEARLGRDKVAKTRMFHLAAGSTVPKDVAEGDDFTLDLDGNDSIRKFLREQAQQLVPTEYAQMKPQLDAEENS